jgi:hypothetical protein
MSVKCIQVQIEKINIDKWNEGCRILQDPGKEYVIHWIEQNAAWFREASYWLRCGYKVERECTEYVPE